MDKTRVFYGWKFLLTLVLPLLLVSLAVAWLTFDLLARVSTGANTEDRERTSQIIDSALGAIQNQFANLATDNAHWDDAVRFVYNSTDDDLLYDTWGVGTQDRTNYDALLAIDRDKPEAIFGYLKGLKFTPIASQYLSGKLDPLLDLLPKDNKNFESKAAIIDTADGLALVSAAPVLPTSEDLVVPQKRPRYLVFIKFLTPEYVAVIGKQYVIQDLKMVGIGALVDRGEVMKDFTGTPIASIQWTDRRPGDIAINAVWWKAIGILSALALALMGIIFWGWHLIRNVDRAVKAKAQANKDADMFKDLNHQVTALNMGLENSVRELKAAQEEIVSKGRMAQLGQLTATVAHELRNPLNVVRTGAYMVNRAVSATGLNLERHMVRIESGVTRCDQIISQLLDFASIGAADLVMTGLDDWLASTVEEESAKLSSDIAIKCTLGLDNLVVPFDAKRMHRVVANIISNASEAMVGKNGMRVQASVISPMIEISTRLVSRGVEIIFSDNGPGMSDEVIGKIREPLFTTKNFGTGLGLPAVEQILQLHGGGLDIWSKLGQGARFTAWFPVPHQEQKVA